MSRALFPGRFQPFHRGHLEVIREILGAYDEVVIAIGSAQEAFTCRNPFTAGERSLMIRDALLREGVDMKRIWIIPVPDIHMPPAWTSYLLALAPPIDAVYTGNQHVAELYRWLGIKVVTPRQHRPGEWNGTAIRHLIAYGNPGWRARVPAPVAELIENIDGVNRIKRICRGR